MARSELVMMSSLKQYHDVPRDSSARCLELRTPFQRLTTLEMGKKHKQNLSISFPNLLVYILRFDYTIV